eukprot:365826-Chlamydomonas_euryale.AAC.12
MSSALGTRFQPIQYVLDGGALRSHVKYESPLFGSGWLSASGACAAHTSGHCAQRGALRAERDAACRAVSKHALHAVQDYDDQWTP